MEREFTNPEPAYGGKHCNGTRVLLRECSNTSSCNQVPVRLNGANVEYGGRVEVFYKGDEPELASCARIDGKVNIPPQCLSDGKGSQALCQPIPPRVKLKIKNVSIEVNSTFTEKCYWSGDSEVSVNWTKDGVLLSTNNTLVIKSANFKDKGKYECTAQNNYGKANASFWIDVTGKSSAQVVPDPYPTLTTGDVLSLTCQVNEDTINVTWKKDGDSLLERAKIYTQLNKKESKLTITEVLEEDGGKYFCEGRNKLGFVARSFVNITVKAMALPDQEQAIQMEPLNVEVDEWEIE
ncbi:Titin, partial [Stylophora pistillata]